MIYTIDRRFKSRVERTPRVLEVAEAFGLGLSEKEFVIYDKLRLEIELGAVVYITGQSGSGKSLLLRELAAQMTAGGLAVANIDDVPFEDRPLIDQIGENMTDAIRLLSLAGLNDAYLFVRKPSELSDGQKYRFRMAKVMESGAKVWAADEFTAALDRVTARVVAHNLQRTARKAGATVLVATTHMDLKDDLKPDLYIDKRYRERVRIEPPREIDSERN